MKQVAQKYKQTEVGLIPSDWEVKELGNILTFGSGRDYKQLQNGEIPVYGTGGVMTYVDEFLYDGESVGIGRKGTIDKPVFLNGKFWTVDTLFYTHQFLNSNPKFIYYKFCLIKWKEYNEASGVPSLNKNTLQKIKISFPKLSEQTAIATALSDADALISGLEKLIAKKRNIKQGAMQKLLQPKEGWEHKTLGEIGEITGAGVDKLINENEVPVRLVNYLDVFRRDFIYSNELNHWVTAPQSKIQKCAVKQGDIFFTPSSEMRFDIAISAIAMEDIPDAVYSYHLVRLRLFEDWDLNFRTYIFKTKYFLGQAEQICEGSGKRYVITLPKFRSMKIFYPPIKEEQTLIATILSDMDAEIAALETKLEKYRKVKLGMMQNLLTGKIRLIVNG